MSVNFGPAPDSVTLTAQLTLTAAENFSATSLPSVSSSTSRRLSHDGFNLASTGFPTSSITPKRVLVDEITLGAGVTTLDFRSGVAALDRYLDCLGYKVFAVMLHALAANAGVVNVAPGSANPYPIFGAGNDISLAPSMMLEMVMTQLELPAVSATVKTIDVSGTSGDKLRYMFVLGQAT